MREFLDGVGLGLELSIAIVFVYILADIIPILIKYLEFM